MILAIAAAGLRPLGQVLEPNFVNFVLAIEKKKKKKKTRSSRDHDGEAYKEEPIISKEVHPENKR